MVQVQVAERTPPKRHDEERRAFISYSGSETKRVKKKERAACEKTPAWRSDTRERGGSGI
jgi:hypothetical protein